MNAERAWSALEQDRQLLSELAQQAFPARLAVVGGALRDALLGRPARELDIVLEGASVAEFARQSQLPFTYHPRYDNATLRLPDGRFIDLIRTRGERYPSPGAAPEVFPADLHTDLARRDFSVNAMALDLRGGELIDPLGGQRDLTHSALRPLHDRSFRDDPSRLARGARLAARLEFDLEASGRAQVPDALRYAPQTRRLCGELALCFQEPFPGKVFERLQTWGAEHLFGANATSSLLLLDERRASGNAVPASIYGAVWLALQPDPAEASRRYGLGEKALRLLARARSEGRFALHTPEDEVRRALQLPVPLPGLAGADLVALGVAPGPAVGQALRFLQGLREAGEVSSAEDERAALKAYLESARP
ncbi:CCA tRNA nucleotidyltransferase [Deinococcus peraridilitoris]|uniref:tRNA nucleotidyltransferase/poly(A) polymerase n=1 Tax=Deinococcus peraridilitoris (strain DSM 19664 / LMG 22246 / CIP 109416 / KR-200) TaxID=937777 RepID=K9ZWG9_DEIPD|nr:CCA tRNA nucleotidyltransferase [Deinococcus peraridilitoris]AFZ65931.1 tRNA nucleotidyltransferase/poly(A) polymerase [Deinococcus peraridilitoris DSM 19664]